MPQLDVDKTIEELRLGEKIDLVSGIDFWHTASVPRLNIPSLRMSDGPNGVRGTRFFNGVPAACFPCATALGATWDTELLHKVGHLMGEEAIAKGAHVILGPTINTQRSPLGGRGFESFAEDGVLAGHLAGYCSKGIQEKGVAACLKHFVCNDQEHERLAVDSIVTDRATREIYLLPFQIAMRICKTATVMTAYNKINGTHVSENKKYITDILRKEWGWDGLVMSDWFGTYSCTSESIIAGLDIEMPGKTRWRGDALAHAVSSNKVHEFVLDERVRNVLNLVNYVEPLGIPENAEEKVLNRPEDQALLRRAAAESIVLLKNEDNILPFNKEKSIAVIGPNAKIAAYCGGGSASLDAYYTITPFEGVSAQSKGEVHFAQGSYSYKDLPLIGHLLKTDDGKTGFKFRVYDEPASSSNRELLHELHLVSSQGFLMDYRHPKIKSYLYYVDMEGYFTPEESGVYDFGVVVVGTGKLLVDDEVVVDNTKNQRLGSAFFGNGTVEEKGSKELMAGQKYKITFQFGTAPTSDIDTRGVVIFGPGGFRFGAARRQTQEELISKAVEVASKADQVVVFAGLTSEWETEGYDRPDMDLPPGSDELISKILEVKPNAAIVIQSGTPVTMPWAPKAKALLQAWFGGNECGNGIADVLYGNVNPSGKLPLTFPVRLQDNPSYLNFRSERGRVLYGEDIYVGYRYYEKAQLPPLFPFGHGLSYTTFTREKLELNTSPEKDKLQDGEPITARVTVTNTGKVAGAETVQLWVVPPPTEVNRPVRELKGFAKVHLEPGESKDVEIVVEKKLATSWWDEKREAWASEKGVYWVQVTGTGEGVLTAEFEVKKTRFWTGL
uniref:Probable beta-glucosidase I n=1 Tax=Emericella nidulans (strain FGSC A4 / ATCC 38163 / CBS 112.46 / NRRL 194 / M139) TaxID=227321 RepID=BGLI_EMENI|nr:RecName: Full=Probable beta-glucosidase I; AltName: Full=Beta-D-glucoside glucohydrolase I; AltName: Full=Cellobiase I; AltName: Full=Gentiobiase I [Aspergillus nidulans FGSC A4]